MLRGVERMAERFGAVERQLDEHRTRSRTDVARVTDVLSALAQAVDVVLRDQRRVFEAVEQRPGAGGDLDTEALDRLTEELQQLRTTLDVRHVVITEAIEQLDPLEQRLAAVEQRLGSLGSELEHVAHRDDLRRGVDRVLGAVSGAEQALTGELRAVDARVGALADDVRVVRLLRDQIEALGEGVDGVRQLAARAATSSQMGEVTRELGAVLAEIESARSQVLRVEQSSSPVAAEVVSVGADVDQLGQRIDRLAEVVERVADSGGGKDASVQQVAQRLRQVADSARSRGTGVLDDLRSRRAKKR